jgi:hypothetical protein
MNDGYLRNATGKIIGRFDGNWLRDGTGKLVSRFDKSDNRTRSADGRIVGDGDQRMRLLPKPIGNGKKVVSNHLLSP